MFFKSDGRIDIQMMADKVRINSRGFVSVLGKYIDIVSEEFDQCLLFMGR